MTGESTLRESENSALTSSQFVTNVTGKRKKRTSKGKLASFGATGFITIAIIIAAVVFVSGNFIPTAITEQLLESTDVQYADMVESKKIVLQQSMRDGELPSDTAEILKRYDILVGYIDDNGEFVEKNKSDRELVLKKDDEIITADNFISKMNSDVELYNAMTQATYDRVAAYFDDAANEVFEELGTSRDNFDSETDFNETMAKLMGEGSNISINSVSTVQEKSGEGQTSSGIAVNGSSASSKGEAASFVEQVRQKNLADNANNSALNAADTLKVADTMSKEQRSSLFYALFMENISKMMAGDGSESKIHDVMNFLTTKSDTEVVDTKTGQKITMSGSPMDSPTLYALLSGGKIDNEAVGNYSNERVLKTIRNKIAQQGGYSPASSTVASSEDEVRGSIGRFLNGNVAADANILQSVEPTIKDSLIENNYESLKGINAGEFLAEGAVNLGKKLAKTSGATAGDGDSIKSYAKLNNTVLAMDAKVDRMNRSPFDVSSKNTFLGSIMYNFAMVGMHSKEMRNVVGGIGVFSQVVQKSVMSLLPTGHADEMSAYMTNFGDCETIGGIGAMATAGCAEIATFDTTTLNDPFNDSGFVKFVNENTTLSSSGTRTIKNDSVLADFILYNDERKTPLGVMDGGILDSLSGNSGSIPFISDILRMIRQFMGASEQDKRVASGAAFVNARGNADWQTYKYAQRYVALARTTAMLKNHSSDSTAYRDLEFFEGEENPVVAFLNEYHSVAAK